MLNPKDVNKLEMIYTSDDIRVFKGKYLGLEVGIKEYDLVKYKDSIVLKFKIEPFPF